MADDIVVLDHGETVAHGTPERSEGPRSATIASTSRSPRPASSSPRPARFGLRRQRPNVRQRSSSSSPLPIKHGVRVIDVVRALDEAGIDAVDITRREATLDEVFLDPHQRSTRPAEEVPA